MGRRRPAGNRRGALGAHGEDLAAAYLEGRGFRVVARNWQTHGAVRGELDLVCRRRDLLVFVEVKTRRSLRFGGPLAAVTRDKQRRIRALATAFLKTTDTHAPRLRFDVIGVVLDGGVPEIRHVRHAF